MDACKNCGFEIAADNAVCPQCGKANEDKRFWLLSIILGFLGGIGGLVFSVLGLRSYKSSDNISNCVIGICLFIIWAIFYIFLGIILIN